MNNVVIIGAGASGMMAALTAAEDKNNSVTLLERQKRVGKKLLATGNGRCNLTNTGASLHNYHGDEPEFAKAALEGFSPADAVEFFRSLGLLTHEEYGGRVYPLSNSANSVVDILRFALQKSGVRILAPCTATGIERDGAGYLVKTDSGSLRADELILACGGAAGTKLGGVMDGYELLKPLGHKSTRLRPALVQLVCDSSYPKALFGVRAECEMRLISGSELLDSSRGEVQFTADGVSGPAAFDISRTASVRGGGLLVCMSFLPDSSEDEIFDILLDKCRRYPGLENTELFTGIVHNTLGKVLVKYANLRPGNLGSMTDGQIFAAVRAVSGFSLNITGTKGFEAAQVTAGGIKTTGFDPQTMQSWFMPHLYVCGELLDIDGDCGGYNLQWAWASGRLAGRLGK